MEIEWKDVDTSGQQESVAVVGAVVLRVRLVDGWWRAWVSVGGLRILNDNNCTDRDAAKRAAEEMITELVEPFVADATSREREACAKIADAEASDAQRAHESFESDYADGLRDAAKSIGDAIRARGKDGVK